MRRLREDGFNPTPAMKLYAAVRAQAGDDASQQSLAPLCGVSGPTLSKWKNQKGFEEWLEGAVARHRHPILELLRQVAVDNIDDFKFWEALAYKYGFLTAGDKPPAVQQILKPVDKETLLAVVKSIKEGA